MREPLRQAREQLAHLLGAQEFCRIWWNRTRSQELQIRLLVVSLDQFVEIFYLTGEKVRYTTRVRQVEVRMQSRPAQIAINDQNVGPRLGQHERSINGRRGLALGRLTRRHQNSFRLHACA